MQVQQDCLGAFFSLSCYRGYWFCLPVQSRYGVLSLKGTGMFLSAITTVSRIITGRTTVTTSIRIRTSIISNQSWRENWNIKKMKYSLQRLLVFINVETWNNSDSLLIPASNRFYHKKKFQKKFSTFYTSASSLYKIMILLLKHFKTHINENQNIRKTNFREKQPVRYHFNE